MMTSLTVVDGCQQIDGDPRRELVQRLKMDGEVIVGVRLEVDILRDTGPSV